MFWRLLSPCVFGHADDPLKVIRGKKLYWECRRCHSLMREILPKQKLRVRKVKKARVLKMVKEA